MKKYGRRWPVFLSAILLLTYGSELFAASLTPYRGEPPRIILTNPEDIRKLEHFEPVYPPISDEGNAGGGQAIFRVKAPPKTVWDVISDFPNYPSYNSDVKEATYYKPRQGDSIYVKFVAGPWLYPVSWHIKHNYPMLKKGWGTWELDKTRENSLTECIGFWRVDPVAGTNFSDVSYSVNLEGNGIVLNLFRTILISSGVEKATQWLKKEAERRAGTGG